MPNTAKLGEVLEMLREEWRTGCEGAALPEGMSRFIKAYDSYIPNETKKLLENYDVLSVEQRRIALRLAGKTVRDVYEQSKRTDEVRLYFTHATTKRLQREGHQRYSLLERENAFFEDAMTLPNKKKTTGVYGMGGWREWEERPGHSDYNKIRKLYGLPRLKRTRREVIFAFLQILIILLLFLGLVASAVFSNANKSSPRGGTCYTEEDCAGAEPYDHCSDWVFC